MVPRATYERLEGLRMRITDPNAENLIRHRNVTVRFYNKMQSSRIRKELRILTSPMHSYNGWKSRTLCGFDVCIHDVAVYRWVVVQTTDRNRMRINEIEEQDKKTVYIYFYGYFTAAVKN